jgi:hypothetical protein
MGQPFTVTGSVRRTDDGRLSGIRVVAYDRDMPSIERMRGPQELSDARVDADGRFTMEFDSDRFTEGEGALRPGRDDVRPDLSFRVFAETNRELTIAELLAHGAEVGPDHIAFNATSPVEVVLRVRDSAPQQDESSEYERVVALVTSVAGAVEPADLTDDDLAFIAGEFGWTPDSDETRRNAFLRAAGTLCRASGVTAAAFYGWARTRVPELWTQMPSFDDPAAREPFLRRLLNELTELSDDRLCGALREAGDHRIVPADLAERAQAIVDLLKRRVRTKATAAIALVSKIDGAPLSGYQVTVYDDALQQRLADELSDVRGLFNVSYYVASDAPGGERTLRLTITGPTLTEPVDVQAQVKFPPRGQEVPKPTTVAVPIPAAGSTLRQLRDGQNLEISTAALDALEAAGLHSFADIRRRGTEALSKVDGLGPDEIRGLQARTEMDRITDVPGEAAVLAQHYSSIIAIADTPRTTFLAATSAIEGADGQHPEDGMARQRGLQLHAAAAAQAHLLDLLLAGQAVDLANGMTE